MYDPLLRTDTILYQWTLKSKE